MDINARLIPENVYAFVITLLLKLSLYQGHFHIFNFLLLNFF